jgi:hypothetical protein
MMKRLSAVLMLVLAAGGCVSQSPFDDIAAFQRRLDDRGLGFGVTRVPGHDALVLQMRFSMSEAGEEAPGASDPVAAAEAAAPPGCTVEKVEPQPDGVSYRVDYKC